MSIRDNHIRSVTFDTKEELGNKIDKLTVMIGKLAARIMDQVDNLKPNSTKLKEEVKIEVVMIDVVMISKVIKIVAGQIVETRDSIGKIEVDQDMKKVIEEEAFRVRQENIKILGHKIVQEI